MVDYQAAQEHYVPRSFMFNSNTHAALVIHKTGGDATLQAIYNTFLATGNSVTYGVGTDGEVWQYVPETLGAGGNCCVEDGYDSFWDQFTPMHVGSSEGTNLNTITLSIEHCDPAQDNSTPLTPAQQQASFKLVKYLAQKYSIPPDHIKGHNSIDPHNRANCPGNYPWAELLAFLSTPERNPHMDTQAQDVWNMFLKGIGQVPVSYTTGIAKAWQQNYLQLNAGSPLGPESSTVNWEGEDIQMQLFTGGISAEYNTQDHVVRWYDAYHKQVM